jgi:uncharacterized protein
MAQLPPLANIFTLGTRDFATLRSFYDRLGWPVLLEGGEDFVAYGVRGAAICLFPVAGLAGDGRTEPEQARGGIRFTIGIVADSAAQVDQLAEQVRQAGGRITKEPVAAEFFKGRSCYFADPEDNFYEIVWAAEANPLTAHVMRAAGV